MCSVTYLPRNFRNETIAQNFDCHFHFLRLLVATHTKVRDLRTNNMDRIDKGVIFDGTLLHMPQTIFIGHTGHRYMNTIKLGHEGLQTIRDKSFRSIQERELLVHEYRMESLN